MTGADIRAARTARGWTQLQLATAAGVSQATVNNMEHGRTRLDHTVKQWKVREALGLTEMAAPPAPAVDIPDRIKAAQERALAHARTAAQAGDYARAIHLVEAIVIEGDALLAQADDLAQRIRAKAREYGLEEQLYGRD